MPRYHIDTDTLIACCLTCEPEAAFSFHDLKQIISLTANTQNRYLFCDTTPVAVQKVVDNNKTCFFFYTDFSVALKNPEAALPLKMFAFGYDESLIRSIQKAATSHLRSKASNIAAKYLISVMKAPTSWLFPAEPAYGLFAFPKRPGRSLMRRRNPHEQ